MNQATEKRTRLREGLRGASPLVALGAHDAMTAQLVGMHGFDAIWVSGLGVSTMAHAVPDLNLITMSETLEAAARMDAATPLPIVADCDNGFGGLNNIVRTVRAFERAGIAAICIEDNEFPKRSSLFAGKSSRALVPIDEQARRIRAAKAAQHSDEFVIIGRVEALIAGHGIAEACKRADAYASAGADAILIHSRDETLEEIEGFLSEWSGLRRTPLVCVPTLFPSFTVEQLHAKGFQMVIFANQTMRAAVAAIEETLRDLREHRRADVVDPKIASISHIFELVGLQDAIQREDFDD